MATIFAKTGGNFSALTWQKVVASALAPNMSNAQYDALNTERTIAFTPSDAGDCEGAFVCLSGGTTSGQTVTVKLQEYVGSTWTDRASKTLADTAILGTHVQIGSQMWTYFPFTAAYAITAVAATWRLAISSTSSSWKIRKDTSGWSYAVVLTTTTTYSASDNILLNGGITVTLDQSVTATTMVAGVNLHLAWAASPASSYTLTTTNFYLSKDFNFVIGSEGNPIPYAQKSVINVTNWYCVANYEGAQNHEWSWYGQKPTNYYTKLAASANSGQPVFTTADDMSATWTAGDSVVIYGMRGYETKTILTVVGTTVTLTTNLASKHWSGWFVVNWTRAIQCGIELQKPLKLGNCVVQKLSGVYVSAAVAITDEAYSGFDTTRRTAILIETITLVSGASISFTSAAQHYGAYVSGSVISDLFSASTSYLAPLTFYAPTMATISVSNVAVGGGGGNGTISAYNSTLTDVQVWATDTASDYQTGVFSLTNCTVTRLKSFRGYKIVIAAIATTFVDCSFDDMAGTGITLNGVIGSAFSACNFGQDVANVIDFTDGAYLNQFWLYACSVFTLANGYLLNSITGSWLRVYDAVGTHKTYTTAGTYEKQAVVVRNGSSAILVSPASATVPLIISTTVPAQTNLPISLTCYFRKNSAYGSSTLPFLRLSGMGITTNTATMTDVNDTWQALTVTGTPTQTGFATVEMGFQSAGVGAAAYVDDTDMAPVYLATGTQRFWYKGDVAPVLFSTALAAQGAWTDDLYVVANEATALAYTGIAVDHDAKTIVVTSNHTITELYEYCKARVRADDKPYFLTTWDGITFTLASGWALTVTGCHLTSTTQKLSGSVTLASGALIEEVTGVRWESGGHTYYASHVYHTIKNAADANIPDALVGYYDSGGVNRTYSTSLINGALVSDVNGLVEGYVVWKIDSTVYSGHVLHVKEYSYQPSSIPTTVNGVAISTTVRLTTDSFVVAAKAVAGAYTGIAPTYSTQVLVTGTHTLQELYDYLKYSLCLAANLSYDALLSTADGSSYLFASNVNLVVQGAIALTDTTKVVGFLGTGALTMESGAFFEDESTVVWESGGSIYYASHFYAEILDNATSNPIENAVLAYIDDSGNDRTYNTSRVHGAVLTDINGQAEGYAVWKIGVTEYTAQKYYVGHYAYIWTIIPRTVSGAAIGSPTSRDTLRLATDPNITLTLVQALAVSGITVDMATKTCDQNSNTNSDTWHNLKARQARVTDIEAGVPGYLSFYAIGQYSDSGHVLYYDGAYFWGAWGWTFEHSGGGGTTKYRDEFGNATTTTSIVVNQIVPGSRLQVYDLTDDSELFNGVVAGTSQSVAFTHTGTDHDIRIRLMMVSGATTAYQWYTATGTVTANGLSLNAAQEANDVYETINVDGSLVTTCSISGTTIRVYVDDDDGIISAQEIYAWFQYYLSTEAGIRDQDDHIQATDSTHLVFRNGLKLINQNLAVPLNIVSANIVPETGNATDIFDLANGACFALGYRPVEGFAYSSGSGLSTTEHNQLMALPGAAAIADAVYDEPTAGHTTASTFGAAFASLLLWLRTFVKGGYHFDKLTKVETLKDTDGSTVTARTVTDTGTEITKQ